MNPSSVADGTVVANSIHPATHLGGTVLAVANAERSVRFYHDLLGLQVLEQTANRVVLGAGDVPLLTLLVQSGLRPRQRGTTGLYHVAILLPTRRDLAQVLQRLLAANYPIGASDHLVSEALYLNDPDGNGLEIYRDRSRDAWRYGPDGRIAMSTLRLDLANVLGELESSDAPWPGMPAGTTIGHMHLQVGDLAAADAFYRQVLGFDLMTTYPGALFLSAGGYHHHLGLNIWESAGAAPAPANTAGLRAFSVLLPDEAALAAVLQRINAADIAVRDHDGALAVDDPWGNTVLLAQAHPSSNKL